MDASDRSVRPARRISPLRNAAELLIGGLFFPAYVLLSESEIRQAEGARFVLQLGGLWLLGILLAGAARAWWWARVGSRRAAARQLNEERAP